MKQISARTACLLCALAAGVALGIALASEHWGSLVPCALCLWERTPYRVAIGLGAIGFLVPARWVPRRLVLALILLTVLAAAGLAAIHVGVEQGFWPSPLPECAAPVVTFGSIAERLARMPALPAKPCDEPTFLIPFLPVSMAAMNLIFTLAFASAIAIYLGQRRGPSL
jgi:disulfide bond formation protein DsbB